MGRLYSGGETVARETSSGAELQRLKAALKEKNTEKLYFFHGEETFLMRYYLDKLKKQRIDELTESFNYHRFNNENFALQEFVDAVESMPMMAEFTMVQVDDVDPFKLPEAERNKVGETLADIPDWCCVVFTYLTVEWKPDKRYKSLWEAVDTCGTVVEFAKQSQADLIAWVGRHFAARNKRITTNLCAYLIEITGGTMTALGGEIEKICAYSGADEIKKSDIDAVTEPVMDAVVFQMTDLIGQGNFSGALLKLDQLLKMQQEPIAILGAVGGQLRKIAAARVLMDSGRNSGELMKMYAMGDYAARKTMDSARRFSAGFCAKAAELVLETDNKMKSSYDAPERLLEMLVLQLAQEARNG